MKAIIEIKYNSKNITNEITDQVISFSYKDKTNSEADEIELEIIDINGDWIGKNYPKHGDLIEAKITVYDAVLNCGKFRVDNINIRISNNSTIVSIQAISAGITKALRTKRNVVHESKTLKEIVTAVADTHQLRLYGDIPTIRINSLTQFNTTDLAFLNALGSKYGFTFSVRDDLLIFTDRQTLEQQQHSFTIDGNTLIAISIQDTITKSYGSASIRHHVQTSKEDLTYTLPSASNSIETLNIDTPVESFGQAERVGSAALYDSNSNATTGSIESIGNPTIIAGSSFILDKIGYNSGKWYITESTHTVNASSYTTSAEIKLINRI
ncbi:hypothetical protein LX64_04178 [Chitinophaga skermanii]|uniref:Phage protein D n=1 Tax=Chitinophaga skermanii TaxID=331697 RepID=A0A327QA35_9BACT|nr:hypothetical protein [Chitinophaga skermanii]RAJ00472.1 hypothetical protein LX64_04178 [Chitinophaga skermanii]